MRTHGHRVVTGTTIRAVAAARLRCEAVDGTPGTSRRADNPRYMLGLGQAATGFSVPLTNIRYPERTFGQ
jgi:hypothetical protein